MQQQISKKIIIYLFILLILGTFNNKYILNLNFSKKEGFKIIDLSEFNDNSLVNELNTLKDQNLFLLKKDKVLTIINNHKIIENFSFFKNYPSNLNVKIEKTKFLAVTKRNGSNYYVGSNGNLILMKKNNIDLPFIFGEIEVAELLELKRIIDNSSFDFNDIKNLYYFKSKRWDIETKNDLIFKLPVKNIHLSLKIISKIKKEIDLNNFKIIDLRQKNQVILNG
tara:strand:+ start:276 stop:947 length:672 start_codon:yes stop_codon:yes gene_type:complete